MSACLLVSTALGSGSSFSFWVWNRHDPLTPEEQKSLAPLNASLFWLLGELDLSGMDGRWRWREAIPSSALPVVRLNLSGDNPFEQSGLIDSLARLADAQGRLQIDCDCPDRLLGKYAQFLGELRKRVPHLSASALAGWSRHPAFGALQDAVEELLPMFYDLIPDPARIGPEAPPLPLLDLNTFARQLASWKECKVRWMVGLPNFSRITVYDEKGRCLGHVRNCSWDEVVFQPRLCFASTPCPGVVLLKAQRDFVLNGTPIKAGTTVAVRWVDAVVLAQALELVKKSPAEGVAFFRLPDSLDSSGWSVLQLSGLSGCEKRSPSLCLHQDGEEFVLKNDSGADLPPRLLGDGSQDRGYALEIDAPSPVWREALVGDFWRVSAHADPDGRTAAVTVPLSTRLTFWFSALRAGKCLKTGLIQLAPDTDLRQIRYRILPGDKQWKSLAE